MTDSGLLAAAAAALEDVEAGSEASSVAARYATAADAGAEAQRLFASNSEGEDGVTARILDVSGIPGARAVELTGDEDGQMSRAVEVVFVTGTVLHEVFVFGPADALDSQVVLEAARALFERTDPNGA